MLISHKYKFIFIKAKKVSGTSTEAYLERYCLSNEDEKTHTHTHKIKEIVSDYGIIGSRLTIPFGKWYNHKKPDEIKNHVGFEIWNSYKKICNIRNPYDIAASYFFFENKNNQNFNPSVKNFELYLDLNIYELLDNKKFWMSNGLFFNDFYIRQENLKNDLYDMIHKLNIPLYESDLPTYKITPNRPHYSLLYNEKTKKIISQNFGDILEKFKYVF